MPFLGKTPTKLLDANVNIDGGNIDGTTIGASSTAPATVSTFTSTGIDDNATSTAITIDSSENVGIGTTNTSYARATIVSAGVNGADEIALAVDHGDLSLATNQEILMRFGQAGGSGSLAQIGATYTGGTFDGALLFKTNSSGTVTERMRIDALGNVGIGTDSPLTVSNYTSLQLDGATGGILSLSDDGTEYGRLLAFADNCVLTQPSATGNIHFRVGGTNAASERMRIDSSGDLLLGTTTTRSSFLTATTGNLNIGGGVIVDAGSGVNAEFLNYRASATVFGNSGAEQVRIDSSGNVKLNGLSNGTLNFAGGNTADGSKIQAWNNAGNGDGYLAIEGFTKEYARIDASGNVGIGETSPDALLHLKKDTTDGIAQVSFENDARQYNVGINGLLSDAWNIYDVTAGANRFVLDSSGRVGIGIDTPSTASGNADNLVINENGNAGITIRTEAASGYTSVYFGDSASPTVGRIEYQHGGNDMLFYTSGQERMRLDTSGNLLIGRTSTVNSATDYGTQLYSSGQIYLYSSSGGTADVIRGYDSTGTNTFAIDADGTYQDLSDAKYKENIAPSERGLPDIMALNVVSFDWNNKDKHETSGFIAQEIEQCIPELVAQNEDTGDLRIRTNKLIPMLTKALQEAVTRIETLEAEVAALKGA